MVDLEAAQTLMDLLTAPNESAEVRDNAAKSLAAMSGNARIGTDPQGWQSWWATQPKNPAEFHDNILAAQASQLATLKRQYSDTQSSFSTFVDRSYHSITDLQARGTKLLEYLTSPDPIIRAESARIVHDDKAYGVPLPPAEQMQAAQAQLQKMVGDPEPQVRLAAADAIAVFNDRSALKLLIAQLDREEDPGVKAALARALGTIGDVQAAATLLPLLSDTHDTVVAAAAKALASLGPQLQNITRDQARQAAKQLQNLFGNSTPGTQLRQEVMGAMAQLRDDSLLPTFKAALNDPNEISQVKVHAIEGIANLKDEKSADDIIRALQDPDQDIRRAACEALPAVNGISASQRLVDMLQPGGDQPAVQEKAWDALRAFLPSLDVAQLEAFADEFGRATPALMEKKKVCLEQIRDKLIKSAETDKADKLALAHQQIGDVLMDPTLADYDGAATEYDAAISTLAPRYKPTDVRMVTLYRLRFQAILRSGKYSEAMAFAKEAIAAGAFDARDAGGWIVDEVTHLQSSASQNPVLLDKGSKLIDESQQLPLPQSTRDSLNQMKTEITAQQDRNKGSGYTTPDDSRINAILGATARKDR